MKKWREENIGNVDEYSFYSRNLTKEFIAMIRDRADNKYKTKGEKMTHEDKIIMLLDKINGSIHVQGDAIMNELVAIRYHLLGDKVSKEDKTSTKCNLLQLKGLGADLWKDVDVRKYIEELRKEWEPTETPPLQASPSPLVTSTKAREWIVWPVGHWGWNVRERKHAAAELDPDEVLVREVLPPKPTPDFSSVVERWAKETGAYATQNDLEELARTLEQLWKETK